MGTIPLVALSAKQPEAPDILGSAAKAASIGNLLGQNALQPGQLQAQQQNLALGQQNQQMNAINIQQKQKEIEDQAKIEKILTDSGSDFKSAIPQIMAVNPQLGLQYQKSIMDSDAADLNHKKAIIQYHNETAGRLAQLAGGVTDETSFHNAIGRALSENLIDGPTAAKYLSQPFSPDEVKQIQQQALTAKDQLDLADKQLTAQTTAKREKQAEINQAETSKPPDVRDYEYAQKQGYKGTFEDWKTNVARTPPNTDFHDQARADKSYQFSSTQLDKMKTPIDAVVSRLSRLNDTLAQNSPQADALVAPELMTVMAGGQGSGIRINEAEINRVVGGRSKWEDLKAAVNKWQLDPKEALSITPEQRQEIRALTQVVNDKVTAKQQALDEARQQLIGTQDPTEHRKIVANVNSRLSQIDTGGAQGGGGQSHSGAPSKPPNATHTGVGSVDKKKHWLDAQGKDLGLAE
jgi:hypothetical protein